MKKLMMGLFATILCFSFISLKAQNSKYLNEQQQSIVNETLKKDQDGKVRGFSMEGFTEALSRENLVGLMFELTKSKFIVLKGNNEIDEDLCYSINEETGAVECLRGIKATELVLAGEECTSYVYEDREPIDRGCKPNNKWVCTVQICKTIN